MTRSKQLLILAAFNILALVFIFCPSLVGVTKEDVDAKIAAAIERLKGALT